MPRGNGSDGLGGAKGARDVRDVHGERGARAAEPAERVESAELAEPAQPAERKKRRLIPVTPGCLVAAVALCAVLAACVMFLNSCASAGAAGGAGNGGERVYAGTFFGRIAASDNLQAAEVVRVVDGDTLKVRISGEDCRVRLIGIDCAESVAPQETGKQNTAEGVAASDYTKSLVAPGSTVWLQKDVSDRDKYDRLLRYVWLERPVSVTDPDEIVGKMLNAILVTDGYAQAKRYKPDTAYAAFFETL